MGPEDPPYTMQTNSIVNLFGYQKRALRSAAKFRLWRWSRQIGKSFAMALDATIRGLTTRRKQLMLSSSQQQSDELMAKVHQHAEAQAMMIEAIVETERVDGVELTKRRATLANGAEIITIPANPRTARGFTGDVYLDEFAMHQDDTGIWASVFPSITRGDGRLTVASTPKGKQNLFYKLHGNAAFEQALVTIHDAVADGYPANVEQLRAGIDDEELWRQEYLCEFLDETTAYLTYEMIAACERADATVDWPADHAVAGDLYVGMDIGRRRDLSVIWTVEVLGDVAWTREVVRLHNTPFNVQETVLYAALNRPNVRRCCIDATGLGMQFAERAQRRFGEHRVEAVTFSNAVKAELAGQLRVAFEDQTIRIPIDAKIRNGLHAVKKVVTAAGNVRYDAESTADGHADEFWAAALATHAHAARRAAPRAIRISGGGF